MNFNYKALIDGPITPVSPALVKAFGGNQVALVAAYLLQQLDYYLNSQACAGFVDKEGLKWIYNSMQEWAELLGVEKGVVAKAIKLLTNLKVVYSDRCQRFFWNQTPHYRINYVALREFCADQSLKLSIDACAENEAIDSEQSEGSKPQDPKPLKQRLPNRLHSNTKQDCPASFEEAAQDPSANGNDCSAPADIPPVADPPLHIVARLEQEGVDSKGAEYLARNYSEHEIMRQIGWIGQRGAAHNRAGMLRRAIEQNWSEPRQGAEQTPEQQAAAREQKAALREQVEQWVASLVAGKTQLKNSLGQVLTFIKRECGSLLVELDGQRSMVSAEVAFQKCTVVA